MTFALTNIKTASMVADETLANAKTAGTQAVHRAIQAVYDATTAAYPAGEQMTWDKQEAAARAHLAGTATADQTAALTARTDVTGQTLTDLSNDIVTKADQFVALGMALAGIRSVADTAIEAAVTSAEVDAAVTAATASIAAAVSA